MTDEQRLKEIRERREGAERVIREKGWAFANSSSWKDIDFLLSLLDGQVALSRELALIVDVGTNDDPGTALTRLRKVQSDAAILMRDACIQKVKDHFGGLLSKQVELYELIRDLESVTTQEQEKL